MQPFEYNALATIWHKVLFKLSYYYEKNNADAHPAFVPPPGTADETSQLIYDLLSGDNPCMVARFGSTELYCLSNYLSIKKNKIDVPGFIKFKVEPWWWDKRRVYNMRDYSGFFPIDEPSITRFCEMMLKDIRELDILASWLTKEEYLKDYLQGVKRVFLPQLEPYYSKAPWTRALGHKKVVVVHPFAELIEEQYSNNRERLFSNPNVLPEFKLRTVKAVQSLGGENSAGFSSWFDALKWMEDEIDKEDYEICLIGCGAYGFPLAAHCKRMGKKAIHLGGALQLLFGIKGNRWEDPMYGVREWGLPQGFYMNMFNEYWTKAGTSYKPKNAKQVEGACYW